MTDEDVKSCRVEPYTDQGQVRRVAFGAMPAVERVAEGMTGAARA
ncbi:hypothetical protein [Streptomyces sp. S063]|nr:hypothetical protein [Streptomyces sp. S063]